MEEEVLYKKRIGIMVYNQVPFLEGINVNFFKNIDEVGFHSSYPSGLIKFYRDHLVVSSLFIIKKDFSINYNDIQSFDKEPFRIRINHTAENIPLFIYILGTGYGSILFKNIKKVSVDNNLNLKFNKVPLLKAVKNMFIP